MKKKSFIAFIFLLISTQLFSQTILKDTYSIDSYNIYTKDIFPNLKQNIFLYEVDENKHSKRVKSSDLIKKLKKLGIDNLRSSSRYIKFQILSPIDTTIIETFLRNHYLHKYKNIKIKSITISTRGYIKKLPKKYIVEIRDRSFLSQNGVVNTKEINNKKIFFNYNIDADIKVLKTKQKIKRGEKISLFNTKHTVMKFDKFKASPISELKKDTYQTKRQIKADKVLTTRDIETLNLVHKNSQVSVGLYDSGIYITFSAKALQNGKLGDIITIQKSDLKRLKVRVVGKKKVEIR